MSKLPNDDQNLVEFLRQNRPEIPPTNPELEEKLFQAIASSPHPQLHDRSSNNSSRFRKLWLVPPAIAASLALAWTGNLWRENYLLTKSITNNDSLIQSATPNLNTTSASSNLQAKNYNYYFERNESINYQELVKIENFLENNWNGVVNNIPPEISVETIQKEYFDLAEAKAYSATRSTKLVTRRR
ncbi:hypothetical protein ACE1B6_03960 [Aerosakkonemataceae cyanobacterium BLCC-F154]|uniref:Anti-sigma factor n=1 Tax=Floridaenema fluviatile BLCC-F154 TaxID=3153640 RepID=A0ABV4Y7A7_9CYAN